MGRKINRSKVRACDPFCPNPNRSHPKSNAPPNQWVPRSGRRKRSGLKRGGVPKKGAANLPPTVHTDFAAETESKAFRRMQALMGGKKRKRDGDDTSRSHSSKKKPKRQRPAGGDNVFHSQTSSSSSSNSNNQKKAKKSKSSSSAAATEGNVVSAHDLRFDSQQPGETFQDFKKRLRREARDARHKASSAPYKKRAKFDPPDLTKKHKKKPAAGTADGDEAAPITDVLNPNFKQKLPEHHRPLDYRPKKEFIPFGEVAQAPPVLSVRPKAKLPKDPVLLLKALMKPEPERRPGRPSLSLVQKLMDRNLTLARDQARDAYKDLKKKRREDDDKEREARRKKATKKKKKSSKK